METRPLVSTIIPVHNGARYLREAIESVRAQTYAPIELVVVDDGSTDDSGSVAASFPGVRCQRQEHAGQSAALNLGCRLAQGEFVGFLDSDDVWDREKVALQMAAFEEDPRLDAVFGHVRQFYSPELDEETRRRLRPVPDVGPAMLKISMLIRRSALTRVGPFDSRWRVGDFVDWYARAMDAGLRSRMLPHLVAHRRIHTMNMGILQSADRLDYVRIVRAALDRRRSGPDGAPSPDGA